MLPRPARLFVARKSEPMVDRKQGGTNAVLGAKEMDPRLKSAVGAKWNRNDIRDF
jgi:hypothetical protein